MQHLDNSTQRPTKGTKTTQDREALCVIAAVEVKCGTVGLHCAQAMSSVDGLYVILSQYWLRGSWVFAEGLFSRLLGRKLFYMFYAWRSRDIYLYFNVFINHIT